MSQEQSNAPSVHGSLAERVSVWRSPWVNTLGRFMALLIVFMFFALLVPKGRFYTARNLENILRQSCVYATAALGATMVIVLAGIDLSVGSIIGLTVMVMAWVLRFPVHTSGGTVQFLDLYPMGAQAAAFAAAILVSAAAGFLNGTMVVGLRLVPFIVTLGTMGIFRGIARGVGHDNLIYPVYPDKPWITNLLSPTLTSDDPSRKWMILPPGVWLMFAAAIGAALLMRYTRLGRHIFAIGSNEETARLCGVPVGRTKIVVYTLAGVFTGLSTIMLFSYISGIGDTTSGQMYELYVIASVVIGGGSLMGGEGTIMGSLIGALMITILYMGGEQMGWPQWVQQIVIGSIIIIAVSIDQLRHRRMT